MRERIVVDSSVLVAIMNDEPEAATLFDLIDASVRVIGWPTVLETRLWVVRRGRPEFAEFIDSVIGARWTECVSFDGDLEAIAHRALIEFGKGRHLAQLNFGDCMTYAIAAASGLPLLFKGGDFSLTDIAIHPASVIIAPADI